VADRALDAEPHRNHGAAIVYDSSYAGPYSTEVIEEHENQSQ